MQKGLRGTNPGEGKEKGKKGDEKKKERTA